MNSSSAAPGVRGGINNETKTDRGPTAKADLEMAVEKGRNVV